MSVIQNLRGKFTSELYTHAGSLLICLVVALIPNDGPWAKAAAALAAAYAQRGYNESRRDLKLAAMGIDPSGPPTPAPTPAIATASIVSDAEKAALAAPYKVPAPGANALLALFLPAALLLGGCGVMNAPTGDYVAADRATYTAVADRYVAYVEADAALPEGDKARRERTIATWKLRLDAAEKEQASKAPASPPAQ